ncbi:hypothetical protein LshimejAT787_0404050 [Lyophyllum shimeji]|uniref:SnoaL-like domain-containing protein n=1 Tax=Lyophyllum shimeji TaxID=47721 RepID=A0A9P3PKY0_LYOSH|nr:hypothetical protein LshimejAT787_0404050 [Lyophyllum shimeji]
MSPSTAQGLLPPSDVEIGQRWIVEMYSVADAKGITSAVEYLTPEATVYFGDSRPCHGRHAIERLCQWESAACVRVAHRIKHIEVLPDRTLVTLMADYHFTNGVKKTADCSIAWHKRPTDNKASRADIRGDLVEVIRELVSVQGPPDF